MPQLARYSKSPSVGFYNRFANRQPHARSVNLHALVSSSIEFFEHKRLLEVIDAGAAIGDVDGEHLVAVFRLCGDANWSVRRRILRRVFDQVDQNLPDVRGVHPRQRKSGGDSDIHRMTKQKLLQFFERFLDYGCDGCGFEAEFDFVGIQLRHLGGFSDQPVQAVALFVDDREQFLLFLWRMIAGSFTGTGEKRGHRGLNGGQWRTKFMGNRIEQYGAQLLAFAGRFGAAEFYDRAGALDRDRHQAA